MKFDLKRPCKDCPFRSDIPGYLTKARAREIIDGITRGQATFSCHKTNDFSDGDVRETRETQRGVGTGSVAPNRDWTQSATADRQSSSKTAF